MEAPVPESREVRGQLNQAAELLRADRTHPRRPHHEQIPDSPAQVVHPQAEERVVVGVPAGELEERFARLRGVVPAGQRPPVPEWGEGTVERLELQAVPCEVEVVNDLRPEQADHVGEDRNRESRQDLLAEGGAAHPVVLFDQQNPPSGPRQVTGRDQPVVPAPDDDGVVAVQGLDLGLLEVRAPRARKPRDPIPDSFFERVLPGRERRQFSRWEPSDRHRPAQRRERA